jgi:hypothetical protein
MKAQRLTLALLLAGTGLPASLAAAQERPRESAHSAPALSGADDWRFEVTPLIWATGIDGDITVRGTTASVGESFLDLLDESDTLIGLSGRFEVHKGKWGGFIDGMYAELGVDGVPTSAGIANVENDLSFFDFALSYRVREWPVEETVNGDQSRMLTLDVYAGARWSKVGLDFELVAGPVIGGHQSWVDPIVGAQIDWQFAEDWRLIGRGDIGGFGLESDFTWSLGAMIGYDFTMFDLSCTVLGGYRALGVDYEDGGGASRFAWDATLHGPLLGLTIRF